MHNFSLKLNTYKEGGTFFKTYTNQLTNVNLKLFHKEDFKVGVLCCEESEGTGLLFSAPVYFTGSAGVGHTDKIGRLKELCEQYDIWLHVEG